ncbi:MAG: hypothetical protein AAGC60_07735 [Acidobacteriota bacterium]
MRHRIPAIALTSALVAALCCSLAAPLAAVTVVAEPHQAAIDPITKEAALQEARGDLLAALDAPAAIRDIYARFAAASAASGHDISFSFGETATYRPDQFDELVWLELFTEPGGWSIETIPHTRLGALPSDDLVSLVSAWESVDDTSWRAQDFLKRTTLLRASEATSQLADWDPERIADLIGLSTVEVTVSFDGRERSYRALALWKPLSDDTVLFTLVDHVTSGVTLAFHEERVIVSRQDILTRPETEDSTPLKDLICLNWTAYDEYDPTLSTGALTNGHSTGSHGASLRAARYCSQNNCTSFCSPYSAFKACNESGSISNPLYWHKKSNTVAVDSINGYGEGRSECGYGWGCAVKSCLLGVCGGISFGATGRGASLKVNATSGVLSDMSISKGGTCRAAGAVIDLPCGDLVGEVASLSLGDGIVKVDLPAADFKLTRLESSDLEHHGQPLSYLMGEWALLSYQAPTGKANASVATVAASNYDFASAKQAELESVLSSGVPIKADGEQLTLVVGLPPHEANSRKIAMPELQVASARVPAGVAERKVLVRADFAEDHSLQGLDFLHDSVGAVPRELALHIEDSLALESASDEEHRVVVFALLSVGETLEIDAVIPYLPKCCCGVTFCV